MDYTPQEVQLLTKTLPGIAAQLRGTLANMHAALSSGDTPDTCKRAWLPCWSRVTRT